MSSSCEIPSRWMPQNLTNKKSTLVQVMVWCLQSGSHYLSQWWPKSISRYSVTRSQSIKRQVLYAQWPTFLRHVSLFDQANGLQISLTFLTITRVSGIHDLHSEPWVLSGLTEHSIILMVARAGSTSYQGQVIVMSYRKKGSYEKVVTINGNLLWFVLVVS